MGQTREVRLQVRGRGRGEVADTIMRVGMCHFEGTSSTILELKSRHRTGSCSEIE